MKVAVVGCGAMGSIYATRVAGAVDEVVVVERNTAHLAAIQSRGLEVQGPAGVQLAHLRALPSPPNEQMDLVILAVKAAHAPDAARQSRPMVGPHTLVLTIQNGLGTAERVAEALPPERLAVGIASGFGAQIVAPGRVRHNAMRAVTIGPYSSLPLSDVQSIAQVWAQAGFETAAVADIRPLQWQKLICNVAYSGPAAVTGMTVGEIAADPGMAAVSRSAAVEAWKVAQALGIQLAFEDPVKLIEEFGAAMPNAKPSALQDLEAGRVSEIDVINGAVPLYGAPLSIPTPVNSTLVALVKAREQRARQAPAT